MADVLSDFSRAFCLLTRPFVEFLPPYLGGTFSPPGLTQPRDLS